MKRYLPILITLIFLPILLSLGFWQLGRAAFKENLQTQHQQRANMQPLSLQELNKKAKEDFDYFPVKITGYFDNAHTFLLDNKPWQGQIGYHVLTPFKPVEGGSAILVDRGWIPRSKNRKQLPSIPPIPDLQTIYGYLGSLPAKTFRLGHNIEPGAIPRIQQLELNSISQTIGYPLAPMIVFLDLKWMSSDFNADKHIGYAIQWFSLAGTLLILCVVVTLRKK